VIVVTALLGLHSDFQPTGLTQARRLVDKSAISLAKDEPAEDDEEAESPKKDHPPKEVSHFTQDQVKKWMRRSWWRDNALPTTPSYNDADSEAAGHPMGSTFVQSASRDVVDEPGTKRIEWPNGDGLGSEKLDYWWHMDRHQGDPGETYKFDGKAAHPPNPSWNNWDREPQQHPMGFTA